MSQQPVLWSLDARGVATVTLNRPEVNNAYDAGLIQGVLAAMDDLRNRLRLRETLRELPQQVIVSTHDLDLARDADRVLVVDEGRIVADGSPADCIGFYEATQR